MCFLCPPQAASPLLVSAFALNDYRRASSTLATTRSTSSAWRRRARFGRGPPRCSSGTAVSISRCGWLRDPLGMGPLVTGGEGERGWFLRLIVPFCALVAAQHLPWLGFGLGLASVCGYSSAPSTNQGAPTLPYTLTLTPKHKPKELPARTGEPTHLISPAQTVTRRRPACGHRPRPTRRTSRREHHDPTSDEQQQMCCHVP